MLKNARKQSTQLFGIEGVWETETQQFIALFPH